MPVPEALAFDMYGTLVDPSGISKVLERYLPEEASYVSRVWRHKQLEYTFRLTAMGRYEDFERVTRKALDYALVAAGRDLESEQRDALMARYDDLERFAEVGAYKPSPETYRHAARRLGRSIVEVRLVSSNPFDVVGAEAAGMRAAWVDRSGGPFDTLGSPPEIVVATLTELAHALG